MNFLQNSEKNRVILHISLTPFTHESRALKEANSSIAAGLFDKVLVTAVWEEGLPEQQNLNRQTYVWRVRLRTRRLAKNFMVQALKYLEWFYKIVWGFRDQKILLIQCHSLATLPIAVALKSLWQTKLVYDAHELETEINRGKGVRKWLSQLAEKYFIKFADGVLVVSDMIADWYVNHYKMERPIVVRNIPITNKSIGEGSVSLKEHFQIPYQDILFIYQGGLALARGVERLLEMFGNAPDNRHIVFMGSGPLAQKVKEYEEQFPNIHYLEAVPPEQVIEYTSSADVGFCLTENTCLSHYYSLPNKFFEYLISGLPVIINDLPEQRKIIEDYDCGWVGGENDQILLKLINSLSMEEVHQKREKAANIREKFSWDEEVQKLLELYRLCLGAKE